MTEITKTDTKCGPNEPEQFHKPRSDVTDDIGSEMFQMRSIKSWDESTNTVTDDSKLCSFIKLSQTCLPNTHTHTHTRTSRPTCTSRITYDWHKPATETFTL